MTSGKRSSQKYGTCPAKGNHAHSHAPSPKIRSFPKPSLDSLPNNERSKVELASSHFLRET
ncbi:hypothetical protein P692DRAFT_20835814 [Suillus brevipes Sb2]|nr:hypothetical protein P692DRAFT_20835814 [Suillus brevipes Sb2]